MSNTFLHNVNGEIVTMNKAQLGINDLGLIRGYAVFDFFKVMNGKAVFIEDHVERFLNSTRAMELDLGFSKEALIGQINALIRANEGNSERAAIRLQATGGYSENSFTPSSPNYFFLYGSMSQVPQHWYEEGIKLLTHPYQREMPEVKTTNYLCGITIEKELKRTASDAVLYIDGEQVRESDRANFFIITKEGILATPSQKILAGITRKKILEIAPAIVKVEIRDVHVSELKDATEAFITSSTKNVVPVVRIDDFKIGNGKVGAITEQLGAAFQKLLA